MNRRHTIISPDEEGLHVRLLDESGMVLFDGYGDMLVTSCRGSLELRLNFGEFGRQEHFALYRAGGDALLLQLSEKLPAGRAPLLPVVLPWWTVEELWEGLRYDPQELSEVPAASVKNWLEGWAAGAVLELGFPPSLQTRLSNIRKEVVAEDPTGEPSVKSWLEKAISSEVEVHLPVLRRSNDMFLITAFIDHPPQLVEWKAIAGHDRDYLTIGRRWLIRISAR